MISLEEVIRQLTDNAEAIRALVGSIADDQAQWQPDPDTWSMRQVIEHFYNEERIDFRKHLVEMLNVPPMAWEPFHPEEHVVVQDFHQSLKGFLAEREASLVWLKSLISPDWNVSSQTPFGSPEKPVILRAGDVLVSWVEHDFLHLRQLIELQYAWTNQQASPYSVKYAGDW